MPLKIAEAARCPRCNDRVYAAEEVSGAGSKWHKKCFSCKDCRKKLDSTNCSDNNGRSAFNCLVTRDNKKFDHINSLAIYTRKNKTRLLDHLYEHVLSKSSVYLNLLLKCKFIIRR